MAEHGKTPLGSESGFALIGALLVMVLVTALGGTAVFRSQMDLMLAGNYRVQRTAEAAADGALDLVKATIFGNTPALFLPLSIPTTYTAARDWRAGADTNSDGFGDGVTYSDADIDATISIKYKQEDNINYNGAEDYSDEVVRYGKDYNYQSAQKDIGKQPVYTATFTDNKTGVSGESDLISTIGFRTPAAIFVDGTVEMRKYQWATQESIELISGAGTPALATTRSSVTIEAPISKPDDTAPDKTYTSVYCTGSGCNYVVDASYIHPDVYLPAAITAEYDAGRCVNARDWSHVLLGVGDRNGASYPAAGGVGACAAAAAVFKFYRDDQPNDPEIVQLSYSMPSPGTFEGMIGTTFAELKTIADRTYVQADYAPMTNAVGTSSRGLQFSAANPQPLGTASAPVIVFFESNMDTVGTRSGDPLMLTTDPAGYSISGYGILVIDGDADILGSIDWTGLMIVRGNLVFKPYEGGSNSVRSGPSLKSDWKGFIMIGGNLQLWTYWGGKVILGYSSNEVAAIKGVISSTVPHKVLSWRRSYN